MNISEENSPCGQHSCVWWETQSPNWPEEPTKWAAACELSSRPPDASSQLPVKICRKKKVLWRLFSLFKKRAAGSGEARSCLSETFGLRDQLQFSGPGRSGSGSGKVSHFMQMRTSVRRCPARYPYLAPEPGAVTVTPLELLLPIKSFKYRERGQNTLHRIPPSAPALVYSTTLHRESLRRGWVGCSACSLPTQWHLELILCVFAILSDALIHYPAPPVRVGCVCLCAHRPADRVR